MKVDKYVRQEPPSVAVVSWFLLLCVAVIVLTATGCAVSPNKETLPSGMADSAFETAAEAPVPEARSAAEPVMNAAKSSTGGTAAVPPPSSEGRSRIYSASLGLEVPRVEAARDGITDRVVELGGRVESIRPGGLVVLVPAENFFLVLDEFENIGRLVDRSVQAYDVSDRLADLETRLRLAAEARERLYRLLDQADETSERVAILREIRRLSEAIDRYENQLETLGARIRYSRISITLYSSLGDARASREAIPFEWMRALDPFSVTLESLDGSFSIDPGPEFAIFNTPPAGDAFYAESASGAVVRIGSVLNEPLGDESFWRKSLLHYLKPLYADVTLLELSGTVQIAGVVCTIPGKPAYLYELFAVSRQSTLYIIEGLFPENTDVELRNEFHRAIGEAVR